MNDMSYQNLICGIPFASESNTFRALSTKQNWGISFLLDLFQCQNIPTRRKLDRTDSHVKAERILAFRHSSDIKISNDKIFYCLENNEPVHCMQIAFIRRILCELTLAFPPSELFHSVAAFFRVRE